MVGLSRLTIGSTSGYLCPRCGASAGVTDSRQVGDGSVRRRRKCVQCAHRFTTYEVPGDRYTRIFGLGALESNLETIIAGLNILLGRIQTIRKTVELIDDIKGEE